MSKVTILTAGRDPYYALGLLSGLAAMPLEIDFIGNGAMQDAPAASAANVRYLNFHPEHPSDATRWRKVRGVVGQYAALIRYALTTDSRLFHILWYNKFEWFDNTVLVSLYMLLGKRIVFTVHNVNRRQRDGRDDVLNHWSLKYLYRAVDHIFVHTAKMKDEIHREFGAELSRITVIPFGMNSFVIETALTRDQARNRLGASADDKILLFFGNIAPYKGLDILINAIVGIPGCRLIIAGPVKKGCSEYWESVKESIESHGLADRVMSHIGFIPEDEVEVYFKASDVVVLPYRQISQSGVLFLSYNFGIPVIANDVGGFTEVIVDGVSGILYDSGESNALAHAIRKFFASKLYEQRDRYGADIRSNVKERHSWTRIAGATYDVYSHLDGHLPRTTDCGS